MGPHLMPPQRRPSQHGSATHRGHTPGRAVRTVSCVARAEVASGACRVRDRIAVILTICAVCVCSCACVYARLRKALALKRRAAVSLAAVAAMALLALAAIAISDSNERTELAYRSSLDPAMNPAIGY